MEIRKIQSIGGSSLSLVLPKKWADSHKLKSKDELIAATENTGSLILWPAKSHKFAQKKSWDIHTLSNKELEREIIVLYIAGFDEIILTSKNLTPDQKRNIKKTAAKLAGMETVEETSNEITLKNLLSPERFEFQTYLDKMFLMTKMMLIDSFNSFLKQDTLLAADVAERDDEIDKIDFLILRMYNCLQKNFIFEEQLKTSLFTADFYQNVSRQMERVADHAVKISNLTLLRNKTGPLPEKSSKLLTGQFEELKKHLENCQKITLTLNKDDAHELIKHLDKSQTLQRELTEEATKHNLPYTILVSDSFDRMTSYLKNIAEHAIVQALS